MVGLVSRRRRPFDLAKTSPEPYVEVPLALSQVAPRTCPWKDKDAKAWRALSNVPHMSERANLALIRIIIGSVADPGSVPQDLGELDPKSMPKDLRPHLCVASHEQVLLDSVVDTLQATSEQTEMPDWHWNRRRELESLPPEFRRLFLWSLHLHPWERISEMLAAFDALHLGDDAPLRGAMARLLSRTGPVRALAWSGLLLGLAPDRRLRAAELILESGAATREPTEADATILASGDDAAAMAALG